MIPKELLNELPNAQGHYGEIRTVGGSRYIRVDSVEKWLALKDEPPKEVPQHCAEEGGMNILTFEIKGPWWTDCTLELVVDPVTEEPTRGSYLCASDPSARFDFSVIKMADDDYLLKDHKKDSDKKAFVDSSLTEISYWYAPEAHWYDGELIEK